MKVIEYGLRYNEDRVCMLIKEKETEYDGVPEVLGGASDVRKLMCDLYDVQNRPEEHSYMLSINTSKKLTGVFEISHGTTDESFLYPKEIYTRALLAGAAGIYIIHSHPEEPPNPTPSDIQITNLLISMGNQLRVMLMDHIIIGQGGSYYSMYESGDIEYAKKVEEKYNTTKE